MKNNYDVHVNLLRLCRQKNLKLMKFLTLPVFDKNLANNIVLSNGDRTIAMGDVETQQWTAPSVISNSIRVKCRSKDQCLVHFKIVNKPATYFALGASIISPSFEFDTSPLGVAQSNVNLASLFSDGDVW